MRRPFLEIISRIISRINSLLWKQTLKKSGKGFHIGRGALINGGKHIEIGDRFFAGQQLWIDAVFSYMGEKYSPTITIGNDFNCSNSVHIAANFSVTIGDGVLFGSRVHITDHAHGRYNGIHQDSPFTCPSKRKLSHGFAVKIESNVWLGDGVVVLPGVTIGHGVVVGANSVVTRSIPPNVIAVGAPAIPIKKYDFLNKKWIKYNLK